MFGWETIPLLPLRCVLDHLSMEDALAAMSTCRHWRNAILLYEGRKKTLKLRSGNMERNMFLVGLFKKHVQNIHVRIDSEESAWMFLRCILPLLFDVAQLQELIFIGPSYWNRSAMRVRQQKISRILAESLLLKQLHCLHTFGLMGCEFDYANDDSDRYLTNNIEYYSRPLNFNNVQTSSNRILTKNNIGMMRFAALQHIIIEHRQLSNDALATLTNITKLSVITINVLKTYVHKEILDWQNLNTAFDRPIEIRVNLISLATNKFADVITFLLSHDMYLTSLKVLFCKTLHEELLGHVVTAYKDTLRELVWADAPRISDQCVSRQDEFEACNLNPFVLLCWQCTELKRLVIHGYWVWFYDLIGFVRLRQSLSCLEVAYLRSDQPSRAGLSCVTITDPVPPVRKKFTQQINKFTTFKWSPIAYRELDPALKPSSTHEQRINYVIKETCRSTI